MNSPCWQGRKGDLRPVAGVGPASARRPCRARSLSASQAPCGFGCQPAKVFLVILLPVAVDLPRVERQAGRHQPAGGQFLETFGQGIEPRMPIDLGALELEGRESRGPIDHMMRIVEVPVEGCNPPFGPQALVKL